MEQDLAGNSDFKQEFPGKTHKAYFIAKTSSPTYLVLLMLYLENVCYNPTTKCNLARGLVFITHAQRWPS